MLRKLLVLLIFAVVVFGVSTSVFAQFTDVCETCGYECTVGMVGCPQAGQDASCGFFDFETRHGYNNQAQGAYCNAVFSGSNCLNAGTTFHAGHRVGVALTIMVDGLYGQRGAYWSQPASANIAFAMSSIYANESESCNTPNYTHNFGPGKFFKSNTAGKTLTEVTTLAGNTTCTIGSANQATRIITDVIAGYTITDIDELNKMSRWRINIPEIRIDPNILHNGERISVKIETLDLNSGGICADCVVTCECIIDVANVCTYTPSFNTLTVASSDPASGVSVTVNPSDNSSQGLGTTPFSRTYNNNTTVILKAPSRAGGNIFSSWTGCTITSGTTCNVTMNSAKAVTANFIPDLRPKSLPLLPLLLGN